MTDCDVLIVGGGPAGSTCARALRQAGWNVLVVDRARFPRDKVCGGWLTVPVFDLLELAPAEYRSAGLTLQEISAFRTGLLDVAQVDTPYPSVVSYAIRRCEFDTFLLRRAGAAVREGTAITSLHRQGDVWVANGSIRAPLVIGAGGHFCPIAARLRGRHPHDAVVAKEAEFPIDAQGTTVSPRRPELFFCDDLQGYGWCVRKGDYLNIGIGRRTHAGFAAHVERFVAFLESSGKAPGASRQKWRGHAYLASGLGTQRVVGDGLLLVGDAAGLAYPESGEGIRPAIESALLASAVVSRCGGRFTTEALEPYQEAIARRHPARAPQGGIGRAATVALGRALLRSRSFTRRVVLDRWFLRTHPRPASG